MRGFFPFLLEIAMAILELSFAQVGAYRDELTDAPKEEKDDWEHRTDRIDPSRRRPCHDGAGGYRPANSAAVPADVSADIATMWDGELPGLPNARLMYAGMSAYEVDCMLAGGVDCGWEIAFALRDGALCVIGLVGVGKAVTAWRLKKKLQKLGEATKAKEARGRAILSGIVGLLAGECLDFAASVRDLLSCWDMAQLDVMDDPEVWGLPRPQTRVLA